MELNRSYRKLHSLAFAVIISSVLGVVSPVFGQTTVSYIIDTNSGEWSKLQSLGKNTFAEAINEAGQVAGYFYTTGSSFRAFITGTDGVGIRELETLGGAEGTVAFGINNVGQVVGFSAVEMGDTHAFMTGPNGMGMRDLGTLGGPHSHANDINDDGLVVGDSWMPWRPWSHSRHAFITGPNGKGMTDLGVLLGNDESFADAINATGQVTGYVYTHDFRARAFITGPDGQDPRVLGVLDGTSPNTDTYGNDINATGQVVGSSSTSTGTHAFITGPDGFDGIGMIDLGTLGGSDSRAYGVNDIGQVVGSSMTSTTGDWHAFVTGSNGTGMMDLNSLVDLPEGVILGDALDINNNGQVIALASIVPEPETYALMFAGLGLIGFIARRKKSEVRL